MLDFDAGKSLEGSNRSPVPSRLQLFVNHSAMRYLVIGGASFLIDFGLLALFFQAFAWPLWLATGAAFLISFVFNYLLQRAFSFSSQATHATALSKYLFLLAFNTAATIGIVWLIDMTGWGWGAGKVVATIITTGWNYFVYRYWVFAIPKA
ncbi:GtrA family protein [Cryobacterium sp. TMT1-62]|uniref:GtrA family protein n=1 Tax=unclassified Cryobacterium TaxID=2649013 RepID=UPI000CE57720|nr:MULTISPECIES: GtrA family protein [unclassified Cryobacterium]TFD32752.1 GtrA family protein [Cryobacterium sp. TMT1-62]